MMYISPEFEIAQLRQQKLIAAVESLAVFIASLFTAVFLPQLLIQYYYASQPLLEEPMLLRAIPVAAFAVGMGYFVITMLTNLMRHSQIKKLEKKLAEMD